MLGKGPVFASFRRGATSTVGCPRWVLLTPDTTARTQTAPSGAASLSQLRIGTKWRIHMSLRGSLALRPRTRRAFVLFWTAILIMTLAFQYAAAATPRSALAAVEGCDSFAIWTTDVNGDTVNQN